MAQKKNPQDVTLRNNRARKTEIDKLSRRLRKVEIVVDAVTKALREAPWMSKK